MSRLHELTMLLLLYCHGSIHDIYSVDQELSLSEVVLRRTMIKGWLGFEAFFTTTSPSLVASPIIEILQLRANASSALGLFSRQIQRYSACSLTHPYRAGFQYGAMLLEVSTGSSGVGHYWMIVKHTPAWFGC